MARREISGFRVKPGMTEARTMGRFQPALESATMVYTIATKDENVRGLLRFARKDKSIFGGMTKKEPE